MNIQRINKVFEAYQPAMARTAAAKKTRDPQSRDEVSISSEAKLYDFAKKAAGSVPEVREDKVSAIMRKLESGQYSVSSEQLASKILDTRA